MNEHLSLSSKLINITEIVKEISPYLTDLSGKRINEEVGALENSWHDLGDQISEREHETRKLLAASKDVLELISECNDKLRVLESELNCIDPDGVVSDFETFQKQICVSGLLIHFFIFHLRSMFDILAYKQEHILYKRCLILYNSNVRNFHWQLFKMEIIL